MSLLSPSILFLHILLFCTFYSIAHFTLISLFLPYICSCVVLLLYNLNLYSFALSTERTWFDLHFTIIYYVTNKETLTLTLNIGHCGKSLLEGDEVQFTEAVMQMTKQQCFFCGGKLAVNSPVKRRRVTLCLTAENHLPVLLHGVYWKHNAAWLLREHGALQRVAYRQRERERERERRRERERSARSTYRHPTCLQNKLLAGGSEQASTALVRQALESQTTSRRKHIN